VSCTQQLQFFKFDPKRMKIRKYNLFRGFLFFCCVRSRFCDFPATVNVKFTLAFVSFRIKQHRNFRGTELFDLCIVVNLEPDLGPEVDFVQIISRYILRVKNIINYIYIYIYI
jgi:hypothetical protein